MRNDPGELIEMRRAIDLHSHPAPCLFPRRVTDRQVVEAAASVSLGGVLLKCHHESTVTRAWILRQEFPQIFIFGGIVLNRYVGGYNPKAVEAALELGGKEVWLPTIDSAYHAKVHGSTGIYDVQTSGTNKDKEENSGITALHDGELTSDARSIFELIAHYDVILGTSHQSYDELKVIIPAARKIGIRKILITHPFFKVPGLSLEQTKTLVEMGAIAEFGYCTISPMWAYADISKIVVAVRELKAENCVLMSDTGQRHNPLPSEALFLFAQGLYEKGISKEEIDTMIRVNPARLLGINPDELMFQDEIKANVV